MTTSDGITNEDEDYGADIDWTRTIPLGNSWAAAVCITPDGDEALWLISPDYDADIGCACPESAPHEQDGPLPDRYWYGLHCCGAANRTDGRPCRNFVSRPGDRCHHHRAHTAATTSIERNA